jgi:membrane associated rhomboid family serine protease
MPDSGGSRIPFATLLLIAVNLGAAFWAALDSEVLQNLAFRPNEPAFGGALGSLFVHANLLHLLGNMVFLAAVGAAVEIAAGPLRFLAAFFGGGAVGILAHWLALRNANEPAPLLGASACVAGCVGYYATRYLGLRVPLAPKVAAPVGGVAALWAILQVLGAFVRLGDSELAVSYWAHLGGLVGGLLMSALFRAPDLAQIRFSHEALERLNEHSPAVARAAALKVLESRPDDVVAWSNLAEAARKLHHPEEERDALREILGRTDGAKRDAAILRLAELDALSILPALDRFKLASETGPNAAVCLLRSLLSEPSVARPSVLLALAGTVRETCEEEAARYLAELEREFPLEQETDIARKRGWL